MAARPGLALSPALVRIGRSSLPRCSAGAAAVGFREKGREASLQLLRGQERLLESLAACIGQAWMCILVGGPASGKGSAVRVIAELAGRPLLEIALTAGTDTSDLLGGFEQLEPSRKVQVRVDRYSYCATPHCMDQIQLSLVLNLGVKKF